MIEKAGYDEHGNIVATIDGERYTIPDDLSNRHRKEVAEWEVAGNTVTPYVQPEVPIPDTVSARQFKMQLEIIGKLDAVEAWVNRQNRLVKIAYENSANFVRDEPMMQSGFAQLGFTEEQIDEFFKAAVLL